MSFYTVIKDDSQITSLENKTLKAACNNYGEGNGTIQKRPNCVKENKVGQGK